MSLHCEKIEISSMTMAESHRGAAVDRTFWLSPLRCSKPMIDLWSSPERSKEVPDFLLMMKYVCPEVGIVIPSVRMGTIGG